MKIIDSDPATWIMFCQTEPDTQFWVFRQSRPECEMGIQSSAVSAYIGIYVQHITFISSHLTVEHGPWCNAMLQGHVH